MFGTTLRWVWRQGHVFDGKLYLARDICKGKQIPKQYAHPGKIMLQLD